MSVRWEAGWGRYKGDKLAVRAALSGTASPGSRLMQLTADATSHCGVRINVTVILSLPTLETDSVAKPLINGDGGQSDRLAGFARLGSRLFSSISSETNSECSSSHGSCWQGVLADVGNLAKRLIVSSGAEELVVPFNQQNSLVAEKSLEFVISGPGLRLARLRIQGWAYEQLGLD